MHFGIISTGLISGEFAQAISLTEGAGVSAVYSRSLESAEDFIAEHNLVATGFDSVEELCASPVVDAVYIASPNSLHIHHALIAIGRGKHVVVEKPAAWNQVQWDQMWAAAEENNVLIFEAARHIFEPAQPIIRDYLVGKKPTSVRMNFSQYSSRWDAVEAGEEPNIFSLETGGGALVDLGIYAIYNAIYWFGEPDGERYFPSLAPTGADGSGTLVLMYKDFNVTITIAKNAYSDAPSEILLGRQTLQLSSVQGIDRVSEYSVEDSTLIYDSEQPVGSRSLSEMMRWEAEFFTDMIQAHLDGEFDEKRLNRYRSLALLSRTANDVCTKARYGAGIFFENETAGFSI